MQSYIYICPVCDLSEIVWHEYTYNIPRLCSFCLGEGSEVIMSKSLAIYETDWEDDLPKDEKIRRKSRKWED